MCKRIFFLLCVAPLCSEMNLRDLSLQGAEEITLEYNKNFLIAQESTLQANERKLQAVSRFLPAVH